MSTKDSRILRTQAPTLNLTEVKKLFKKWGAENEARGHKFNIRFLSSSKMEGCAGIYDGRVRTEHFIRIINNLLFGDFVFEGRTFSLNSVAIHELRHVYWNIVDPCKCKTIAVLSEEFDLRPRCWAHNGDEKARISEESDCDAAELTYQDFAIFKTA